MSEIDERLAAFCTAGGHDGVVLRRRGNMSWAGGGSDFHCDTASSLGIATLVWTPGRKVCWTDTIESPRLTAEEPLTREGWEVEALPWWEADTRLASLLASGRYATDWPVDPLYECRASLTAAEVDRARSLGRETAGVVERIMREDVKLGMTEFHLGGAVAGWLRDRGIFAHVVLVAADDRIAAYRHPIPTAKPIERTAMVAVCAQRRGLIVSLTRLVHFGATLPEDLSRRHAAVIGVDRALHGTTRVGRRWCDALADGVRAYAAGGYPDEWTKHHQGGPMGYECRDFKATPTETRAVKPRQLVGWNPTVSGTKSEDTILTGTDASAGVEVMTPAGDWPTEGGRPAILCRKA
ncbi:MAG: M24 family metallopeptidase [Phycisphaeraceae bacterium]|nr:MAG: M24 family metallopeptidase [Phycisphaeraceae bacterium]